MKKLITAIAAIATSFGLFADPVAFTNSVPSDIQSKTNNLVVGYNSEGTDSLTNSTVMPVVHWFADSLKSDFDNLIDSYEQPELKGEAPNQSLAIDTDVKEPVLRTFSAVSLAETNPRSYKYNNIEISDHGVFIDTETTFTLFDTVPEAPSDSKILVWAKETEADEDVEGATNLMVTCGYNNKGTWNPTNYVLDISSVLPDGLQPETMYRLTIRADKVKDSDNTEFRVYLNTHQLSTVGGLAIFPSIKAQVQELGSAGFGGTGSLKSVDLLTEIDALEKVPFAVTPTFVTFTWDENVASFKIGDIELAAGDNTTTNYQITAFNQDYNVKVTYVSGWRHGEITGTGFKTLTGTDTDEVTFSIDPYSAASLTVTPELARDEALVYVNGAEQPTVYTLLSDVFAQMAGSTAPLLSSNVRIVLNEDICTLSSFAYLYDDDNPFEGELTIDLNGKTLDCTYAATGEEDLPYIFASSATITIMDSNETKAGKVVSTNGTAIIYNSGELNLNKATTGEIEYYGGIINSWWEEGEDGHGNVNIAGGKFTDKPMTDAEGYEEVGINLPEGKAWTDSKVEGFWQLRTLGAVVVTVPALTTGLTITSIKTNEVEVVPPVAGTYTVKEGESVVVTYAAATGYEFADDAELGVRTATVSGQIEPPEVVAIPVELTVTAGTGVESVTYTVNGDTPGASVKIGDVIKITDVTYETGYEADGTYVKDYAYTVVAADVDVGSIAWTVLAKKQTFTVTVDASNATLSTNGAPVAASSFTAAYGTVFTLTATAADGYKDAKIVIGGEEKSTLTVTENVTIVVTATQMATWTVTVDATLGEHVLSITPSPTSVREDAASKTITLSATFEGGYELDHFTVDGAPITGNTFEINKSVTVNAVAKSGEPIPPLPPNPTPEQKQAAVDAVVAQNEGLAGVVTVDNYTEFRTWSIAAGSGATDAAKQQAVLNSDKAAVSFQLSPIVETATLFTDEPVVNFTAIAGNGNNWDVTLQLKDGASGEEVELAIGDAKAHFAQFIKKGSEVNAITGTCDPSDITAAIKPGEGSKQVKLTVVPPTGGKGFIKFVAEKPTQSETP